MISLAVIISVLCGTLYKNEPKIIEYRCTRQSSVPGYISVYNSAVVHIVLYKTTDIFIDVMLKTVLTKTSIQIEEETREKLKAIGRKGESYDTIINKLLKSHKE